MDLDVLSKAEVENFRIRNTRGANVPIHLVSFKALPTWIGENEMRAALNQIPDAEWDSFIAIVERYLEYTFLSLN